MLDEGAKTDELNADPQTEGGLLRRVGAVPFHARSRTSVLGLDALARKKREEKQKAIGPLVASSLDLDSDPTAGLPKDPAKILKWPKRTDGEGDADGNEDEASEEERNSDHGRKPRARTAAADRSRSRSCDRRRLQGDGSNERLSVADLWGAAK